MPLPPSLVFHRRLRQKADKGVTGVLTEDGYWSAVRARLRMRTLFGRVDEDAGKLFGRLR